MFLLVTQVRQRSVRCQTSPRSVSFIGSRSAETSDGYAPQRPGRSRSADPQGLNFRPSLTFLRGPSPHPVGLCQFVTVLCLIATELSLALCLPIEVAIVVGNRTGHGRRQGVVAPARSPVTTLYLC